MTRLCQFLVQINMWNVISQAGSTNSRYHQPSRWVSPRPPYENNSHLPPSLRFSHKLYQEFPIYDFSAGMSASRPRPALRPAQLREICFVKSTSRHPLCSMSTLPQSSQLPPHRMHCRHMLPRLIAEIGGIPSSPFDNASGRVFKRLGTSAESIHRLACSSSLLQWYTVQPLPILGSPINVFTIPSTITTPSVAASETSP